MHYNNIQAFYQAGEDAGVGYSRSTWLNECAEHEIAACVCMGVTESMPFSFPDKSATTPMLPDLDELPQNMYVCLGINPHTLDKDAVKRIKTMLRTMKNIVGFKIYAGYYHFYIHDPVYAPIYKIAADFGLMVAIHTGVTYSETAMLEYSHPLTADRLAVNFRDTRFLLCHMGNPWIMDACEIAYKNRNVYLDISGLVEGNAAHIADTIANPLLMAHYKTGLVYLNNYKKILFGTDWPIVPMQAYIDFCKQLTPEHAHEDVFYRNAQTVYGINPPLFDVKR